MSFHAGEIAVQTRAGVREEAEQLGGVLDTQLKPPAQAFLKTQTVAIAATIDTNGNLWASPLLGVSGFIEVMNSTTIQFAALPNESDPLLKNLHEPNQIGILVIDFATRRRLRLNGQAVLENGITLRLQEAFFNCPKYIQTRHVTTIQTDISPSASCVKSELDESDQQRIATADTFFIASAYSHAGADASHRGGFPGFVEVLSPTQLRFPDYAGNNMFQTLGNLTVNPKAGLLFIDFEQGHTLQLTGTTAIVWEKERFSTIPGAQRLIEFTLEAAIVTHNATPQRWTLGTYSPANPK
jgi:uncharacterized protein